MMCNRRSNEIFNLILNKDIYEISDRIEAKEREKERERERKGNPNGVLHEAKPALQP